MKTLLASILLLGFATAVVANPYSYRVVRVLDGDTVEIDAPYLPPELGNVIKLRISGVDTPEKGSRAKCESEARAADYAMDFTKRLVAGSIKQQVIFEKWDKYGGRVVGDLLLNGHSLKEMLISSGYARPYDGGKKESWC